MASGAEAGLSAVDALLDEHALRAYPLLPSVRGALLRRLDRRVEARAAFDRADGITRNARARELLLAKPRDCACRLPPRPTHATRSGKAATPGEGLAFRPTPGKTE